MIDKLFRDIDNHLTELFISIDKKREYKFFPFGVAISAIQKELRNTDTHIVKRFTDYVYYLNKIFVEPYSTITFSTVFNDEAKEVMQITQSNENGILTKECETYTYAEYVVKMLSKYGGKYDSIKLDKCIETLKSQSTSKQDTYTSSYFSTLLKGLVIYTDKFEDISNTQIIADLYSRYFELATPRSAMPEQNLISFKDNLLYLHDIDNPPVSEFLENKPSQTDPEINLATPKKALRGRPRANRITVRECLACDEIKKDDVLRLLHTLIDGKRGKEVAYVIVAAMRVGIVSKITHMQIQEEFGDIGSYEAYSRPIRNKNNFFSNSETKPIEERIKQTAGL